MNFNRHSEIEGKHAFLSASKYHWVNYDPEKLKTVYWNYRAAERGTELHDFARRCIKLGIRLPKSKNSLNQYVNDAIGFRMIPEQPLYFSDNCFGTADAISFDEKTKTLRIHDLKTGDIPANPKQLEIYAALFCHEYKKHPQEIAIELRIYQSGEVLQHFPDPNDIQQIMNLIVQFDRIIEKEKLKG